MVAGEDREWRTRDVKLMELWYPRQILRFGLGVRGAFVKHRFWENCFKDNVDYWKTKWSRCVLCACCMIVVWD